MTNEKQKVKHITRSSNFIDPIPFPDELAHLKLINDKLDAALHQANANVDRADKEYMAAKRYMADYRGEIDPHEMFQNELALKQIDRTGAFSVGIWEKLAKLKESPYFARIDFQTKESQIATKHYIGRFAFSHENELLIIDWRAPFASMFYDCEVGSAGYDAPMGRIEGKLTRKRQFKVKNGVLEYALESSVNIHDDVLQRELSHTSDEKMKSIIATIQKEQNKIIRNEKAGTIIIQGVAGSGKTAIALHRIAFLLYRFKDKLAARNVKILSPNKVFSDYISTVLPELGEEPIGEQNFVDIAKDQLEGIIAFEADKDPLETEDPKWAARVCFKSTLDFVKQMDGYLQELPAMIFEFADYPCGRFVASADWIQRRFYGYQNYPIKKRLRLIAKIKVRLDAFLQSGNGSLGIILKTNSSALVFHKLLAVDYQIQLISPDSTRFTNGISVTSIQMSKGLEFDEVIIPEVNRDTYQCEDDRSLLYIAATRAMHRLTLLYRGEPSRFLPRQ